MQTDAKTYVDSLLNTEQFDIVDLLEKNIYKLTYIFCNPESEDDLETLIINLNCSEPLIDYEDGESEEYYYDLAEEGLNLLTKSMRTNLKVIK